MRVVLDTNIFVSAVLGGRLGVIIDEWKKGKFTLIISEAIVREYLDVINRPKFKISAEEITAVTDYLFKTIDADPSDNKFIEAALVGAAHYVVSGDSHLLDLEIYRAIRMITARDFIARLQSVN